jgi:branched-subunit amino acid transport protein
MNNEYFWTSIIGLSIGTLLIRVSFFFLLGKIKIPKRMENAFAYIPAAVLPALVGPSVVLHSGSISTLGGHERLLALVIATIACYFTKSVLVAIVTGLGSLYAITMLLQ